MAAEKANASAAERAENSFILSPIEAERFRFANKKVKRRSPDRAAPKKTAVPEGDGGGR